MGKFTKEIVYKIVLNDQDPTVIANLHHSLDMVANMIYDLTVNVNTEDGLANAAACVQNVIDYRPADIGFSLMILKWELREGYSIVDCAMN